MSPPLARSPSDTADLKDIAIVSFTDDLVGELVADMGLELDASGSLIQDGEPARCECCEVLLTTANLGGFPPGSIRPLCSDLMCLSDYLEDHLDPLPDIPEEASEQ